MRITDVRVHRFALPLRHPLTCATGTIARREGFVLAITDDAGRVGRGEASPAYWLGDERVADVERVLHDAATLIGRVPADLVQVVAAWAERSPAAACALDAACLDLEARAQGLAGADVLAAAFHDRRLCPVDQGPPTRVAAAAGARLDARAGIAAAAGTAADAPGARTRADACPDVHAALPVGALLFADTPAGIAGQTRCLIDAGHACVKLKVGAAPLADDVARVAAIRAAGGPELEIRLDANRAWSLPDAHRALAALAPFAPAFLEEPLGVADPAAWAALGGSGIPLAVDESVGGLEALDRFADAADLVVVKAARLGGPHATVALAAAARRRGLRVVVTDAIESRVGQAVAVHLAAVLHAPHEAVGLGGAIVLAADVDGGAMTLGPRVHARGPGLEVGT